jgi:hypothetical protein
MSTGIQVISPRGYMGMLAGQPYMLLRNDPHLKRVVLVRFEDVAPNAKGSRARAAHEKVLPTDEYQKGLVSHREGVQPAILTVEKPSTLPPWLSSLEGVCFDADDKWTEKKVQGRTRVNSPLEEVERRIQIITPALKRINEILSSDQPERLLNKIARNCKPVQNEVRFRMWFFAYIAFGLNRWALLPPRTDWGKWLRLEEKYAQSELGRKALTPEASFGSRTSQAMIDGIVKGFKRYASGCGTMASTWAKTVRLIFRGKVERVNGVYRVASHGKGAPSFDRFYYYVHRELGRDEVRRILYGETRISYNEAPRVGPTWADLVNVGQRIHIDACHTEEHPKSYIGNFHLAKLCVVKIVDGLSAAILGIGFSLGSETEQAYRYAMFCAAIPKSKFGEIIGILIADDRWCCIGLPDNTLSDNGPGSSKSVRDSSQGVTGGSSTTPSYDPKVNAPVETKNPRKKRPMGAPSHKVSKLTPIDLMRREVFSVIEKNWSDDVGERTPALAAMESDVTCPMELYRHFVSLHRTSLRQIPFLDAVRTYLDLVEFEVKGGRLYFLDMEYYSEQSLQSGLAQFIRNRNGVKLKAYAMQLVPRYAWIEFKGQLVEVRLVIDGQEAYLSMQERQAVQEKKKALDAKRTSNKKNGKVASQDEFKAATGKEWHTATIRKGPFKPSSKAVEEMKRLNSLSSTFEKEDT